MNIDTEYNLATGHKCDILVIPYFKVYYVNEVNITNKYTNNDSCICLCINCRKTGSF